MKRHAPGISPNFRYILNYSPAAYIIDGQEFATLDEYRLHINSSHNATISTQDSSSYYGGIQAPGNDYGRGQVSAGIILAGMCGDGLSIGGIYIKYKGKYYSIVAIYAS